MKLTNASHLHKLDSPVKRFLSLFIAAWVWLAAGGAANLWHAQAHRNDASHDESHCHVCDILHAAVALPDLPQPAIQLHLLPVSARTDVAIAVTDTAPLSLTCRGPPIG